nr:hypothetical protein [Streptomyces sp. col6]
MKYLAKQLKSTRAAAQALGVSQRTVERYVAGKLKRPREDLRGRIDREVARRWQPQVRARARRKASSSDGLMIYTRARFGYTAAPGTTEQRLQQIAAYDRPSASYRAVSASSVPLSASSSRRRPPPAPAATLWSSPESLVFAQAGTFLTPGGQAVGEFLDFLLQEPAPVAYDGAVERRG